VVYEVYVRSFQDSDGDGIGDLEGVRTRLDHLAGLGVQTIWLMPVFPAFGPAGYDVVDFGSVVEAYGDAGSLAALVEDAHALGMRVLLDLPFNHVHRDHPWFVAAQAGDSTWRDWFRWSRSPEGDRWHRSASGDWYYAYFGEEMPDLDWEHPSARAAMEEVFVDWLDAGADGYRLDAVITLVEEGGQVEGTDASHALVGDLVELGREVHPDAWFLAEASEWEVAPSVSWIDAPAAPGADAVLDFPRHDAFLDAYGRGSAAPLRDVVTEQVALGGAGGMAGFLGSHDLDRLPSVVPEAQARRALRLAQFLLPGNPVLYYGEEIDLPDASTGTGQDWAMRAPMPWDDGHEAGFSEGTAWFPPDPSFRSGLNVSAQAEDPQSMLSLVTALGCLRSEYGLVGDASWTALDTRARGVLAFERSTREGRLVVVVNLAEATAEDVRIAVPGRLRDVASGAAIGGRGGLALGRVAGWSWRVLGSRSSSACGLPAR